MKRFRVPFLPLPWGLCLLLAAVLFAGVPYVARADSTLQALAPEQLDTFLNSPGQPTLVVVMASWCGPCVEELPRINAFFRKYRGRGVAVVGLSLDFNPAAMKRLLQKQPVDFPVYWVGEQGIAALNAVKVPLFLLLRPGQKQQRLQGALTDTQLQVLFDTLAGK